MPTQPSDVEDVLRVVEAAFGPDGGPTVARLVTALHASGSTRASLVAHLDDWPDGEVVGHVQLSRSWVDARVDCVALRDPRLAQLERDLGGDR